MTQLTERFSQAVVLALDLHRQQTRKGSEIPYASHLLRVSGMVLEYGGDEATAIAAMLHDAVEDQGGLDTAARIAQQFGAQVARYVEEVSDTDEDPKPPWQERKDAYLAHLAVASPQARLISGCDKLDNLRSMMRAYRQVGPDLWERFHAGRQGSLWYHREVLRILQSPPVCPVAEELALALDDFEKLIAERESDFS
jgi:(p)ppGpp synthase/HD superfamily hydrolase